MDIRRYFVAGQSKKNAPASKAEKPKSKKESSTEKEVSGTKTWTRKRPSLFIDSDSDEEPIPSKKPSKIAKKELLSVIIDDSDEELTNPTNRRSPKKAKSSTIVQKDVHKSISPVKPVSASDFFGPEPVRRSSRTPQKKDVKPNSERKNNDEYDIHDDEDFIETLKSIDNVQTKIASPTSSKTATSIAGKLVAKLDAASKKAPVTSVRKENKAELKEQKKTPEKTRTSPRKHPVSDIKVSVTITKKETKKKMDNKSPAKMRTPSPRKAASSEIPQSAKKSTPPSLEKRASFYQHYLQREGPRAPGSKEIPEGDEGCLNGLTFVITGVLDSIERDDAAEIIKKYGGKVTQSLSKNTKYLIVGRDAGPSKLEKANNLRIKQIDEDGLLDLIRTLPGKKSATSPKVPKGAKVGTKNTTAQLTDVMRIPEKRMPSVNLKPVIKHDREKLTSPNKRNPMGKYSPLPLTSPSTTCDSSLLWVDKYKPSSSKQIIGQQGDKSNVQKLKNWLTIWHKNHNTKQKKAAFGKWKADDGSNFKAALLSGPPGVGKTTTAQLVCKETGFTFIELNASDTRSKKNLQEVVSRMLQNKSLSHYLEGSTGSAEKHCLLMDEVDGMAGNEDRGGVQELIQLIKLSKIPVICMCNDRMHQKIRSLSNYCFDLRFQRPRVEQLKGAMMTICYREGISIPPAAMQEIIVGANQDVRQIIHHLSMWSVNKKEFTEQDMATEAKKAKKDLKIGPFDVLRMVFSSSDHKNMSFHDKSNLFFHDYSLAPLFVQENYPFVQPHAAQNNSTKHLDLLSQAADSICDGDLVDKLIRSEGQWSLLPVQAVYASVIPGEVLEGHLSQMIAFPSWLGRNSTRGKNDRLLQELLVHLRLRVSGNKTDLNCDYLQYLRDAIVNPLVTREHEGIPDAVATMSEYYLMREDLDSVFDVSLWPNQVNPLSKLSPQLKAAFTRAYNKESHMNPYAAVVATATKGRRAADVSEDAVLEGDDIEEEEEEHDDIARDAMIKKKTAPKRKAKDADEPGTSKAAKGAKRSRTKK